MTEFAEYYASHRKSIAVAAILPMVLGPLGTLYGSPLAGAILTLASGALFALITVGGALSALLVAEEAQQLAAAMVVWSPLTAVVAIWSAAILLGWSGAEQHNRRVLAQMDLWRRLALEVCDCASAALSAGQETDFTIPEMFVGRRNES
ncbi:hypothetical protein [Lamprocystis purpurea]|jgi:hypothetical protein|uniref:hypothetical protein n=1 Tax=Lamprocystis purpurea TaxID=61598 RepID=UPI0003730A6C|nr:hypothetical protein [Lamprocystis purpurea]